MMNVPEQTKRLAADPVLKHLMHLPEFTGWVNEKPARLEALVQTLPYPYSKSFGAVPQVASLEAISAAIVNLKQQLPREDLREWGLKNREQVRVVTEDGQPDAIGKAIDAIGKVFSAREEYQTAIQQLKGPQKTVAEQALKQLNKAVQPVIEAELEKMKQGFAELKTWQENGLAVEGIPDSIRQSLETARDFCDLAALHIANKSLMLDASVARSA